MLKIDPNCEFTEKDVSERLIKKSDDGKFLILNEKVHSTVQYLRETQRSTFHVPCGNVTDIDPMEFLRYFSVYVETVTEYEKVTTSHNCNYKDDEDDGDETLKHIPEKNCLEKN